MRILRQRMNAQNVVTGGKKEIKMVRKPTVISLFAGCGGSSLGYKMAGFKELLAIDFDKNSVETFRLNFPEVPVWNKDITAVSGKEILDFCKIKPKELDVLDGSPPCQGFSTAGKRNVNDSRNSLFKEYSRLINELQPKVFVMENVSGMVKGTMKGLFIEIMKTLKNMNYNVSQSRQRLFFIGVRKDLNKEPVYPKPTGEIITVKQAWINVDKHIEPECYKFSKSKRFQYIISKIKSGQKGRDIDIKKGYFNTCKIRLDKPCLTIFKQKRNDNGLLHPTENRFLSISELKRLSSFPDDFKFIGSYQEQWARIGNAVMPNQMKAIAETIKTKILEL